MSNVKLTNKGSILVVDFGSQTAHLITRRLKDLGIESQLIDPDDALKVCSKSKPSGIIFSGGPASVYEKGAPKVDPKIFSLNIPILGICYGWQLMAHLMGGEVESGNKEYGPTILTISKFDSIFYGLPKVTKVIESHGDTVEKMPAGFVEIATTETVKFAAVQNLDKKFYGVQFHPEAHHTEHGTEMLKNFATRVCNLSLNPQKLDVAEMIAEIKEKVGNKKVIGAFSGGTDSVVAGALVAKAIGKNFIPFFVDSGLMREETIDRIKNKFPKILGVPVEIISARELFLARLRGVTDPENKRKKIGALYIELFEKEMKKHKDVKYLLQGTTYADFIHSQGSKRSAHIKSHHNVGGLPKDMKLKLLEPLRYFYTDQVREIGLKIGLPKEMIFQQPFPGPGHAVRIVGEVTKERLAKQVQADMIVVEELRKSGWYKKVFQCWSVMTGINSTAVKGDGRFYGEVVAVRIVNSKDRMSAEIARVPFEVLEKIASRIVNEVPNISRVVYDITSKPPATMEWE
ncbi:MAG: Glutamine-hydrolyzing GMP synthase [Microgenomates group bacterium GW2011_GWA2_37_6]|nr:MAG: Glutamine-hydrolyzing GMP synthase [Microgenomates group bacterium GW2011_GWA2_37_6]